jgi:hypothetical protein
MILNMGLCVKWRTKNSKLYADLKTISSIMGGNKSKIAQQIIHNNMLNNNNNLCIFNAEQQIINV